MSITDYSNDSFVLTVNGRQLTQWGTQDPPCSDEPIDAVSELRRGLGHSSTRFNRNQPGRRLTIYLMPGSSDSAYMQGLLNSRADIEVSKTQIGTLEAAVGVDGIITNDGAVGRGGPGITDDQYIMEFATWTASKGGD